VFTTVDPALATTDQAYAYAGGDPVNRTDPTGMGGAGGGGGHGVAVAACQRENPPGSAALQQCVNEVQNARSRPNVGVGNCPYSTWDCFVMTYDPAFWALYGSYNAYQPAQDPCSSNLAIAQQADDAFVGVVSSLLAGVGGAQFLDGLAGGVGTPPVDTPYGPAVQDLSPAAVAARSQVQSGALVFRLGTALGYATTAYRSQGQTVETAHVLVPPTTSRELLYVAATRGREENRLYVETAFDPDPETGHLALTQRQATREVLSAVLANAGRGLRPRGVRPRASPV
jgi:hypothetical protein